MILIAALLKSHFLSRHLFEYKNIGHITRKNAQMMCPTFLLLNFSNRIFPML